MKKLTTRLALLAFSTLGTSHANRSESVVGATHTIGNGVDTAQGGGGPQDSTIGDGIQPGTFRPDDTLADANAVAVVATPQHMLRE